MLRLVLLALAGGAVLSATSLAATPAFMAHKNGTNQTVAQDTDVKLTWSTEGFDTNSNFATDRFTPTIAGKYLIVVSAQCVQAGACMPSIYKNGALMARSQSTNVNVGQTPQVTTIVDLNGSTDYVEAFITSAGSAIGGAADRTYFSGSQIDGSGGGSGSSQWSDGSAGAIYYNSGNVGIGTTSPGTARLNIVGSTADASSYGLIVQNSASTPLIYARNDGNVGIGTTAPLTRTEIYGAGQLSTTLADGGNRDAILAINASAAGVNNGGAIVFGNSQSLAANSLGFAGIKGFLTNGTANTVGGLSLSTRNAATDTSLTERIVITSSGDVGIGTTTPALRMHVIGDLGLPATTGTSATGVFRLQGSGGQTVLDMGSDSANSRVWLQATTASDLSLSRSLLLNPNGGNVGIGTTAPQATLDVLGNPTSFLRVNETGVALLKLQSSFGTAPALKIDGTGTADLIQVTDNGAAVLHVKDGGNVGVGTTAPSYRLQSAGQVAGAGAYVNTSDARLKTDVQDLDYGLETVMRLRPVSFQWKSQSENWQKGRKVGLVAQEIETVVPEVVTTADDAMHIKSIAYGDLTPVLIKAVQEMKAANDNLRAEFRETINSQDAEIEVLRRQVESLKAK